jgi:uncharacterized protein
VSRFRAIFPAVTKPLIAMAHVPALPGTPLYDATAGLAGAVAAVRRDVEILLDAGFDAVMFCNENDRPYQLQAGLESAAAMARVVTECRPDGKPFGVDFLWDARCALAVAAATGANFIREVATGVWESDMGLFSPDAAHLLRERRRLDAGDVPVLLNTGAKAETIAQYLKFADGCIVGSSLKVDGYTWNPVDPDRAKRFVDAARQA